jgi:osmotically inducible protein OsmC
VIRPAFVSSCWSRRRRSGGEERLDGVQGRNGHTEAADGSVSADPSVPKAMGGPGKPWTTTPEHLFAAGYAACFGGALDFVGKQHKKDASKARAPAG